MSLDVDPQAHLLQMAEWETHFPWVRILLANENRVTLASYSFTTLRN